MTDHTEPGTPGEEHETDRAEMESRDRAQPTLTGDRANLRADEVDDEEQREAMVEELEGDGGA